MGISIILQDEKGNSIERVDDESDILHRLLPNVDDSNYQMLRSIDRYGDTTFNKLQMKSFLNEWDRLQILINDVDENTYLKELKH